jgi:hypothetical protein
LLKEALEFLLRETDRVGAMVHRGLCRQWRGGMVLKLGFNLLLDDLKPSVAIQSDETTVVIVDPKPDCLAVLMASCTRPTLDLRLSIAPLWARSIRQWTGITRPNCVLPSAAKRIRSAHTDCCSATRPNTPDRGVALICRWPGRDVGRSCYLFATFWWKLRAQGIL